MRPELQKKIDQAIRLLKAYDNADNPVEIAYSGGKDSDVILQLAKEAGINYRAIYKNTTIDPPGTIKHVQEMGVEIMQPKKSFFQLISERGFPTRMVRFCCQELKEYKILDKAVIGVRKDESAARGKRYNEPTQCRFYGNKKDHVEAIYPILEWNTTDVAEFLADRKIKCAPVYYDEQGKFHPERRLGCMGCPLSTNQLAEFKQYPKLVKAWLRAGKKRFDNASPDTALRRKFKDIYEVFTMAYFFNSEQQFREATSGGLFEDQAINCKEFLENYFNIKL